MELFNGFYAFNAMLIQIARKQEFQLMLRDKRNPVDGTLSIFDEKDMQTVTSRTYNLIGKDLVMQDSRDPLGSTALKTPNEQKAMYDKYRIFQELRADVDYVICEYAQKAIQAFKLRARQGISKAGCKRMVHYINQYVSESVLHGQPAHISQV